MYTHKLHIHISFKKKKINIKTDLYNACLGDPTESLVYLPVLHTNIHSIYKFKYIKAYYLLCNT